MNTRFTICSDVIGHLLPLDTSVLHFVVRMGARQGARDQQRVRLPHPHPWVARPISFVLAPIRTGKSKRTPMPPHVPLRCGVRLSPPALVLDYAEHDSGRVRRRIVPLRAFSAFSGDGGHNWQAHRKAQQQRADAHIFFTSGVICRMTSVGGLGVPCPAPPPHLGWNRLEHHRVRYVVNNSVKEQTSRRWSVPTALNVRDREQ
uniref:Centrosomal protein of 19 kDa isoform X2 n=1 Tax=Petromyzon marinus TaxID=7757 RepID=A0AAJ7WZ26_PETMA|nr:centrosomal protein of 19 kDa isoform X2 [Petromyzon marinus]